MDIVPVNFENEEDRWTPFGFQVQQPGILRMITTVLRPPSTIIPSSMGQPSQPTPIPALIFESDPDAERKERHFMWLAPNVKITYPGTIEFRGTYIDELSRNPMFLYEVLSTNKKGS